MDVYAWGYKQVITSVRATHFFSYRYIDKFYLFLIWVYFFILGYLWFNYINLYEFIFLSSL